MQVSAGLESSTTTTSSSSERQGWEPVLAGLAAPGAVGRSASAVPFDDWCLALPSTDDHFLERPHLARYVEAAGALSWLFSPMYFPYQML